MNGKMLLEKGVPGIIVSNVITLVLAVAWKWDLVFVMLGFWFQSVIHGLLNARRMSRLENYSTEGVKYEGTPVDPTPETRRKLTLFFLLHFNGFHFIYLIFILIFWFAFIKPATHYTITDFLVVIVPFLATSIMEHRRHLEFDREKKIVIGHLFLFPYARILPMHIVIIVGMLMKSHALVLFLVLKMVADVLMQIVDNRLSDPEHSKVIPIQIQ